MVISGDENYSFNKHFAAAIGELTPELERIADVKRAQSFKSQEICSNHPGHINDADNKTVLWFNSGFQHCGQNKNVNFENEFASKKRYTKAKTLEQFKSIFENKLILTHAIIPPFDMDHLTARNNEHEPERSWLNMRDYCYGYTWCAYSLMGGNWVDDSGKKQDTQIKGLTIKFSEKEVNEFKRLGDAWSAYRDSKTLVNDYNKQDSNKNKKEKREQSKDNKTNQAYNKASDKLANYYGSTIGKIFSDDLALEQEAEAEEAKEAKLKAEKEALDQKSRQPLHERSF
ncbi:hypothetical protein QCA50_019067 [Cerrena zonata]|uniref:Uncharacterized protein n=1 Tax=Cerrena zonata TaxID=2478898 RepID=A0AAW0F9Z7_9APHY